MNVQTRFNLVGVVSAVDAPVTRTLGDRTLVEHPVFIQQPRSSEQVGVPVDIWSRSGASVGSRVSVELSIAALPPKNPGGAARVYVNVHGVELLK